MVKILIFLDIKSFIKLNKFRVYDIGKNELSYFDEEHIKNIWNDKNNEIYLEFNTFLEELLKKYPQKFKINISISGLALEEIENYVPNLLKNLKNFAKLENVEFVLEPYYESFGHIYSERELVEQIKEHKQILKRLFNYEPQTFKNTECLYSEKVSQIIKEYFTKINNILINDNCSKNKENHYQDNYENLLLFNNQKLAEQILNLKNNTKIKNLLDQIKEKDEDITSILLNYNNLSKENLPYLKKFLEKSLDNCNYLNSSEINLTIPKKKLNEVKKNSQKEYLKEENDYLKKVLGNRLQTFAQKELYNLEKDIKKYAQDQKLLKDWKYLTNIQNSYYMNILGTFDGEIVNVYNNPYDSYIYFMNILNDIKLKLNIKKERARFEKEEMLKNSNDISSQELKERIFS